jgi:hypothetical protein
MHVGFFGLGTMGAPTGDGGADGLDAIRLTERQAGVESRA